MKLTAAQDRLIRNMRAHFGPDGCGHQNSYIVAGHEVRSATVLEKLGLIKSASVDYSRCYWLVEAIEADHAEALEMDAMRVGPIELTESGKAKIAAHLAELRTTSAPVRRAIPGLAPQDAKDEAAWSQYNAWRSRVNNRRMDPEDQADADHAEALTMNGTDQPMDSDCPVCGDPDGYVLKHCAAHEHYLTEAHAEAIEENIIRARAALKLAVESGRGGRAAQDNLMEAYMMAFRADIES